MALQKNTANLPRRIRVRTLRPWWLITQDVENGQIVGAGDRRVVAVGEVLDVDRILGVELCEALKAEEVDPNLVDLTKAKGKKAAEGKAAASEPV